MLFGEGSLAPAQFIQPLALDLSNGRTYVLLSNLYSSMKNWEAAKQMRQLMVERNTKQARGAVLKRLEGVLVFQVQCLHPQSSEIYRDDMICRIKIVGYVPDKSGVLFEINEKEKGNGLCLHSEKLVLAFRLLITTQSTPLKGPEKPSRAVTAMRIISKVYNREITLRDRIKEGSCSCRDIW